MQIFKSKNIAFYHLFPYLRYIKKTSGNIMTKRGKTYGI